MCLLFCVVILRERYDALPEDFIAQLLGSASDLSSNFLSEVVFLLLNALTLDVVDSIQELSRAAQLLSSIRNLAG